MRGEAAVHGVRGSGRERDQHGAPVLCAGAGRARVDRRPAVDPGRAHRPTRRPRPGWGYRAELGSAPRASWRSTSVRTRTPTGWRFDFVCGDEVYGNCTQLREFFEQHGQAYVLRVASTFMIDLPSGTRLTCAQAVTRWPRTTAGGRSARPVPGRRDNAGTRGRGSPPPRPAITCWSAVTCAAVSWPFTTATCPKGRR